MEVCNGSLQRILRARLEDVQAQRGVYGDKQPLIFQDHLQAVSTKLFEMYLTDTNLLGFYVSTNASFHSVVLSCRKSKIVAQMDEAKRSFFRYHSTEEMNMQQLIGNFRTMFLFRGLAAIVFGILTLVWP